MSLCSKSLGTSALEYRSRLHILDGFEGVYNREPETLSEDTRIYKAF
jgi:hypothetical protein